MAIIGSSQGKLSFLVLLQTHGIFTDLFFYNLGLNLFIQHILSIDSSRLYMNEKSAFLCFSQLRPDLQQLTSSFEDDVLCLVTEKSVYSSIVLSIVGGKCVQ